MARLDRKFFVGEELPEHCPPDRAIDGTIALRKAKNSEIVPDDEFIVFIAKDDALPATLRFYLDECRSQGSDNVQCNSVAAMIDRLVAWRVAHSERCKRPDATPEELDTLSK